MSEKPVVVECYEGGRSQERPRRITIDGVTHTVTRVLDQCLHEDRDTRSKSYHYQVELDGGSIVSVICEPSGKWRIQD